MEKVRRYDPRPYMPEKAAALMKIGEGQVASQVAEHGLLQSHDPDIIYRWLKRWQTEGIEGLGVKKGRGRKAAFSLSATAQRVPVGLSASATRKLSAKGKSLVTGA